MTGEHRRRWDEVSDEGGISLPQRLSRIEMRQDKVESRQLLVIVVVVVNLLLTAGDTVTKMPTILRAFGL